MKIPFLKLLLQTLIFKNYFILYNRELVTSFKKKFWKSFEKVLSKNKKATWQHQFSLWPQIYMTSNTFSSIVRLTTTIPSILLQVTSWMEPQYFIAPRIEFLFLYARKKELIFLAKRYPFHLPARNSKIFPPIVLF